MTFIRLVVGDYFGESHERTAEFLLEIDRTIEEVNAYAEIPILQLFFLECGDVDCSSFSSTFLGLLDELNIPVADIYKESSLGAIDFVNFYINLISYYDKGVECEVHSVPDYQVIDLGGLGLL